MKIECVHGYFKFIETAPGEVSRFMSLFTGLDLVKAGDHFTFATLLDFPDYAIEGDKILGALLKKTCEGEPGEIMRLNSLVYNFNTDTLVPISSITKKVDLTEGDHYFLSPGLILPGSITDDGLRVTDYAAWYLFGSGSFKYSEVTRG